MDEAQVDRRMAFLSTLIQKTLRTKPEKWTRLITTEESNLIVTKFCERSQPIILIIAVSPTTHLGAFNGFPLAFLKNKATFFVKAIPQTISKTAPYETIITGDMSPKVIEQLSTLIDQILIPLLSNDSNYGSINAIIASSVTKYVNSFKCIVQQVQGHVTGFTVLPVPSGVEKLCNAEGIVTPISPNYDFFVKSAIEGCVYRWSVQINDILQKMVSDENHLQHNPLPSYELLYWTSRQNKLLHIYKQLRNSKAKYMATVLEKTKSAYLGCFKGLFKNIVLALAEANDIRMNLQFLNKYIGRLEETEFNEYKQLLKQLMHTIFMVWTQCEFYDETKLIILLKQICNFLIVQAKKYLDPSTLFHTDIDEAMSKTKCCISTCNYFCTLFHWYRSNMKRFPRAKNGHVKPWNFQTGAVFVQLNAFLERLKSLQRFFNTTFDFSKLEKVELGGSKGNTLMIRVAKLYSEFQNDVAALSNQSLDVFESSDSAFQQQFKAFQDKAVEMDLKLLTIVCEAFDCCPNSESVFKLINVLDSFLEKEPTYSEMRKIWPRFLNFLEDETVMIEELYTENLGSEENLNRFINEQSWSPASSTQNWINSLCSRLLLGLRNCQAIQRFSRTPQASKIEKKFTALMDYLLHMRETLFSDWKNNSQKCIEDGVIEFIFARNKLTQEISVNCDIKFAAVTKDFRYLGLMGYEIPDNCIDYKDNILQKHMSYLHSITARYSKIIQARKQISNVEYNLIKSENVKLEEQIERGLTEITWAYNDLGDYITGLYSLVNKLEQQITESQKNLTEMKKILMKCAQIPLFHRTNQDPIVFDLNNDGMAEKYLNIVSATNMVTELLNLNKDMFGVTEENEDWLCYVDLVDGIVLDSLTHYVGCSLSYIHEHMDSANHLPPLFEAELIICKATLKFVPSHSLTQEQTFKQFITGIIEAILNVTTVIGRVSQTVSSTYQEEISNNEDIEEIRGSIFQSIDKVIIEVIDFCSNFKKFSFIWLTDETLYLEEFLRSQDITVKNTGQLPRIDEFQTKIDNLENVVQELQSIQAIQVFQSWFQLHLGVFKQTLLEKTTRVIDMLKEYLLQAVVTSLSNLIDFIKSSTQGFQQIVVEGDYQALVSVMGHILRVREKQLTTDSLFSQLHDTIVLLKTYDYDTPEDINVSLQEIPEQWNLLKKVATSVKQQLGPLQTGQVLLIRDHIVVFENKITTYRFVFRKYPIFQYSCTQSYFIIDKVDRDIRRFENEMDVIQHDGCLFEVPLPDFKTLKQCRQELRMIKQLWDCVSVVHTCIEEWKTTPWREVDVENMDIECKKFAREFRMLDKEIKTWDTFLGLESTLKNIVTSLRAVAELQNPSIKERHWEQLLKNTKSQTVIDHNTTLADLLALNLHECEEEVKTIVDKAVKEMAMEKVLRELNSTWGEMQFAVETHSRSGCKLLRVSEELVETLEEHQVQLQNLSTSKFIAYFLEEISEWQRKLAIADRTISTLCEIQRTWIHLESIFMCSEDIKKQLPEDTLRFAKVDSEFKRLTLDMISTPNVMESTSKPGLISTLDELKSNLVLCEKALAVYLESKRLHFPRFYFISAADLLDILSNQKQPEMVAKHLSKLFDSIARIELGKDENGVLNNIIYGMYARDGEYVPFEETTTCSEAAEIWLSNVQAAMRTTLRSLIGSSVLSYEHKARDEWLFDYPAQASLTGTQIWWTREVNLAFHRLEEGYDGALRDYFKKQVSQLSTLISLLIRDLSKQDRQKVMTICTVDVHSRDVVNKMIQMKIESCSAFQWVSQLRHRWCSDSAHCLANICDSEFRYSYEYLGNTPRLVITPLTDRCYVTLTQSLHLVMGGGPAGPAGTGKTETTKDLGRALGISVYVFNCSEQMDYKSCGNIYKGLAQTGAWGCFDEFNRISVEVLSVIAVQVKSILDAIKKKLERFDFMGEMIALVPTVGIFITMNPGYAGRTELPENLKALFRPCAMVVPDFELICEIMLVAEGFQDAKILARKFITLYTLCKELLSKQDHYDWGLRAIKSVLVVAGALKRGDPSRPEEEVLMRALRDFNVPKIVTDDSLVFLGLIGDLFPALEVPRKRDAEFERRVKQAAIDLKLQPEDTFVLKVVQLEELLEVRHSVFIVGNAGTGKSHVWKTLFRTYVNLKEQPTYNDLDPKAVTNDELFGVINPATREWKDGLLSILMRDQANLTGDEPKWIVLDGDIDPMWIESLNTVMDDNKVLTLASNERIALTSTMRLLFEITNLKTATPATVSRAGILYINPQDLGWNSYVTSWIEKDTPCKDKSGLIQYFDKYIPLCMDNARTRFRFVSVFSEIAYAELLCSLLDCILTEVNIPAECPKEWIEIYFVFCCVWTFGSGMLNEQSIDYRIEFTKWWVSEFKTVKFPTTGTVFDYYIDQESKQFLAWSEDDNFELSPDVSLQTVLVHTKESIRIRYFLNLLMEQRRPVMLVGNAGCGKTALINEKLSSLSENYAVTSVAFNFYTTSEMLQKVLERGLEKKSGRKYAPPGNKQMVYFIDDINMPEVDMYGTVQPHTLIRQHLNYGHWYDRNKFTLKDIYNCQYIACMNPTAGSFTISPRLQRHFCVFAINFPGNEALTRIYNTILSQHLMNPELKFSAPIVKFGETIVTAAIALHYKVLHLFPSTSAKFHYVFNLRDISNIFQGLLFTTSECVSQFTDFVRVWVHESRRVYGDKLIEEKDLDLFVKAQVDVFKKLFEEIDELVVFEEPNIYCHFAQGIGEPNYMPIKTWQTLNTLLNEAMASYNELVAAMNLVLFEDAMMHVCRINRILEFPRGSALLVGVGGSGKQSLSRLAAFISSLEVYQTQLKKGYNVQDFKKEISSLYSKTGLKNIGMVFLITDAQIPSEQFLVVLNDVLASGEVPDLFSEDELENLIAGVGNEVKGAGLVDTRENCWKFFIERVQKQLKIVLCFSPVGTTLRVRCRKFPAVMNCTQIIWFHEWPQEALISVSIPFLKDLPLLPGELLHSAARFMAHAHNSVSNASKLYLQNERRFNYTTPKSFLEQVNLYTRLLTEKTEELRCKIKRLENGLDKLRYATLQVAELKKTLAKQTIVLQEKNDATDALINVITIETEKVCTEKCFANEEEAKVAMIAEEVLKKQKDCEEDLVKAEPALLAAQEALNTLNKANLTELKSFGSPPGAVTNVTAAVMVLLSPAGKIPKDRSWKACKIMMAKVDGFLDSLINYDKENIHPEVIKAIEPYLKDAEFQPDFVRSKSAAAAGLCAWVINIIKFFEVFCDVEPKRKALQAANEELAAAEDKLCGIQEKVADLEQQLAALNADLEKAMQEKAICQEEANATNATIQLANRLVGGLSSENTRWGEAVDNLLQQERMLPGDVLLTTAFISYAGCFTKQYRIDLFHKKWMPFLLQSTTPSISITENLDPLSILTDDTQIAKWQNEGLPSDRMSTENATILTNSSRWPLMIDPQLQGIKWVKQKYGADLIVVVQGHKDFLNIIEKSIVSGSIVLIENIQESVEPVLDSLLGRVFIKRGKFVKVGDKEIEYNPTFRLMLHTKLANPHYKPELQAQTTLINFTVTRDGLEDQLLAEVVKEERLDLEELKASLTKQQNTFKIMLKSFEDDLLSRLSSAQGNLLENTELVENLETTKKTAAEIEEKVLEAKATSLEIDEARESYRPVASRASLLYFILNDLNIINPIYQFSLKAFNTVFQKAITKSLPAEQVQQRIENLIDCVTFSVFLYTVRGLFEKDKLIFSSQMTFQVLLAKGVIQLGDLDFLLRFPVKSQVTSPVDFLSNASWGSICSLASRDEFKNLDRDIENSPKAWKKVVESECSEKEKFPQEWKNKTPLQRLSIMRALRPDRMIYAVMYFIEEHFGVKYIENKSEQLSQSYEETSSSTPVFFILSPGVNPLKDLEGLGKTLGFSSEQKNFHIISLGQGQEIVAEQAMEEAAESGHWVILQNIHLVKSWLPMLEKKVEFYAENSHKEYRIFLTAEPAPNPANHIIPQGILQSSIKITNEPPTGMQANLHKALSNFNQDTLEQCGKEAEFKAVWFALCYFHAVIGERKKFGPQGWNKNYPFNVGDLTISVLVLNNYLERNANVPWQDLRYLFGEIMYGGHITDDWDRRLCVTYLEELLQPDLVDGELMLAPGFPAPPNIDFLGYHNYIDDILPAESPYLYGLHPNAEIGFLTTAADDLFKTVFEMQPRNIGSTDGTTISREEKVRQLIDESLDKLPEDFNMTEIMGKVEERTPYVIVGFQECERMNYLISEIKRSLRELDLGLKGELTITSDMENLENALFLDQVPAMWSARAYPSLLGLTSWFADLLLRIKELETWSTEDFVLPTSVWLCGFFNPQSLLTAVMQNTARRNGLPLDKMCLQCDVTRKQKEDLTTPPKEGANLHGLYMDGARWEIQAGIIMEAKLKELFPLMPVIHVKAITQEKQELRNTYECPLYKTRIRGPTYVWTFNLKTKHNPSKWVLAGVALLLQV